MNFNQKQQNLIYGAALFMCFLPFMSPALALLLGVIFSALGFQQKNTAAYTSFSLKAAIVLMGFGMNLTQIISSSKSGFVDTFISVIFVMGAGILLGKLFKVERKTSLLISAGTAICGGSAIAAVSPVIGANNYQISFSLITIFVLNAVALIIFPIVGHHFDLSQEVFAHWAAIAIHDTSSVVGASATYGDEALEIATTVKLIRAMWIIPLSLLIAFSNKDKNTDKIKIPWFIGLFVMSITIAHFVPQWEDTFSNFYWLGRKGMVASLFLIGTSFSVKEIKNAGANSFLQGITLWLLISVVSFLLLTQAFFLD